MISPKQECHYILAIRKYSFINSKIKYWSASYMDPKYGASEVCVFHKNEKIIMYTVNSLKLEN